MTRARLFRIALPAALALAFVAVLTSVGGPADDASAAERAEVFVDHDALVPETPRRDLPVMLNPRDPANGRANLATLTNDLIDGFLISGGNFQDASLPNGQIVRQPHLLIWDDLNNSLHCRGLVPDDEVLAVAAGPDAGTLIIAGRFNAITEPDGATVARRKIAKVDLDTCTVDTNWTVPSPNSKISELATINGRLFIGGNFTALGGNAIGHLAEVSLETGAVNPNFSFAVDGDQNRTMIVGMDVHPNGTRLGVIHKARTIDGVDQRATAIFDISNPAAPTLTAHQVSQTSIPWRFHSLIQDGGFSPDFSRVIIANGTQVQADHITLARSTEAPGQFEWEKNMWDTTFAIDISNNAVYAGGHFCRIEPGPGATDLMAPNGLDRCTGVDFGGTAWRSQLAAFDLDDGTPLAWNPGSNAYKGIVSLKVVSRGLLIGQDGSRINSFNVGTTSFLDFGQNRDDLQPPQILTATAEQDAGGITVAGTVDDDIRARTVFVDVRSTDGRWLQSNGTLATTPYRFSVTPSATGGFALSSPIPAGSFTIAIDADDHAGRTAAPVQRTLTVAGDVPDAGTCVATIDGANVQLRWGAFNGEDDQYAVRDANGWVASVSADTTEWTGPNGTYTIRSREGGQTVEAPCTGAVDPGPDPDPGPQPDPSCRATPAGANVQLEWDAFNGEDDSYQVRSANGWLATVDADLPRVELVATPPLTILSREKGVSATLECTWDDGANADP